MLGPEAVEGDQVLFGGLEQLAYLRRDAGEPLEHVSDALLGLLVAFGVEDLPERGGEEPAMVAAECMIMSLVKWTVQRCHGQPSTRAIAALSPSCWSEIARRTPSSPRFFKERTNSVQNAPDSTSPTSRPITSRAPDSCTA